MSARTVTILAADVVGYSRLINGAEEETLHRLKDLHPVFVEHITRNNGQIFGMAGDAVQAEFGSAFEAMTAAWELQRSLRARNAGYALDRQMLYRIGLATGEVNDVENEPYGLCIAMAGAMEALAHPGGVCVTKDVHDAIAGEKLWRFDPMGVVRPAAAPGGIEPFAVVMGSGGNQVQAGSVLPQRSATYDGLGFKAAVGLFVLTLLLMVASLTYVLRNLDPKSGIEPKSTSTASFETTVGVQTNSSPESPTPAAQQSPPTPIAQKPNAEPTVVPPQKPLPVPVPPTASATVPPETATRPAVTSDANKQSGSAAARPEPATNPDNLATGPSKEMESCLGAPGPQTIMACRRLLQAQGEPWISGRMADIELRLGSALREAGRTEEAIEVLVRSTTRQPVPANLIQLGVARFEAGQLPVAIADFSSALQLDPKSGEAYNNRAWVRFKSGQLQDASEDARLARHYAGTEAYVWDTSGHIDEALGQRDAAITNFKRALSIDAQHASSRDGLIRLGFTP